MYVLDEPTIGLHQRDNDRLLATLHRLRDLGNSVIVVEHDEDMIRAADHVVDMGPGAGVHGGRVMAQGTVTTCGQPRLAHRPVPERPRRIAVPRGARLAVQRPGANALPSARRASEADTARQACRPARGGRHGQQPARA